MLIRQRDDFFSAGPEHGWRPGTQIRKTDYKFLFNAGGMGDYICYMPSLLWVAKHCPWIHGTLYVSTFFIEFAEKILSPYPNWAVADGAKINIDHMTAFVGPELVVQGQNISRQLLNATGANLVDLGFAYYTNQQCAPPGTLYPKLPDTRPEKVYFEVRPFLGKYVVFTPGAVTESRRTTGKHVNPLIEFVISKGLTPVFLGKAGFADTVRTNFAEDIRYDLGIDLREKTTLLQAAAIMEHAVCVLGLDNGLLHLASCTNANVIFGYNITKVQDREPKRLWGRLLNVSVPSAELPCIACQSNGKLMVNHSYHKCYYGDTKCVDMLFSGGRFERAIEEILLLTKEK